jgi:hypothetical protein
LELATKLAHEQRKNNPKFFFREHLEQIMAAIGEF